MDLLRKVSVPALWIFFLYSLTLCLAHAFGFPNQISPMGRNCTQSSCKKVFRLTLAEKVRIDMLKKHIMNELNMHNRTMPRSSSSNKLRVNGNQKTPQKQENQKTLIPPETDNFLQEVAEIVSFSEKPRKFNPPPPPLSDCIKKKVLSSGHVDLVGLRLML